MDKLKDRRSAYKVGFLTKLAELGILPDTLYQQIKLSHECHTEEDMKKKKCKEHNYTLMGLGTRTRGSTPINPPEPIPEPPPETPNGEFPKAADIMDSLASGGTDVIKGLGSLGLSAGLEGGKYLGYGALAAPLVVGGGAGMAQALLDAPSDRDIEAMRKNELINLYKRITQEVLSRRQQKVI
jgi:hypothetical protein